MIALLMLPFSLFKYILSFQINRSIQKMEVTTVYFEISVLLSSIVYFKHSSAFQRISEGSKFCSFLFLGKMHFRSCSIANVTTLKN